MTFNQYLKEIRLQKAKTMLENKEVSSVKEIAFSVGFYKALGAGESIPFAFEMGKNNIQLQDLNGADLPILLKKDAVPQ